MSDKNGWRKGAGPYSRSYAKLYPDQILCKSDPTMSKVRAVEKLDKIEAASGKGRMSESSLPGGPGGFSAEVSRGSRPKHKQGSWKRV